MGKTRDDIRATGQDDRIKDLAWRWYWKCRLNQDPAVRRKIELRVRGRKGNVIPAYLETLKSHERKDSMKNYPTANGALGKMLIEPDAKGYYACPICDSIMEADDKDDDGLTVVCPNQRCLFHHLQYTQVMGCCQEQTKAGRHRELRKMLDIIRQGWRVWCDDTGRQSPKPNPSIISMDTGNDGGDRCPSCNALVEYDANNDLLRCTHCDWSGDESEME